MSFIRFNNEDIYYEVHGEGEPLLYLHGWNGSMAGFKANVLPGIRRRRIILLDLPGCGRSGHTDISFESMSDLIRELLVALGVGSASVAGFCLGGAFALDFALRYPEMVAEIYLIETSLGFPILLSPLLLPGFGRKLLHLGLRNRWGAGVAFAYLLRRESAYRDDFLASFAANDVDISLRYIRLVRDYSRIDHFLRVREQLKSPLIIVNGEKSPYYVRNSALKLLKEAQNAQLHVLHGARHFIVEERPDLLADILAGRQPELPIHPVASPVRKKPFRRQRPYQGKPAVRPIRVQPAVR